MVISLQNLKTMHILLVMTCSQNAFCRNYFINVLTDQNALWGLDDRQGSIFISCRFLKKCMKDFRWDSAGVIMRQEWSRSVSPVSQREILLSWPDVCTEMPANTHNPSPPSTCCRSPPLSPSAHVPLFCVSHLLLFHSFNFLCKCSVFFCVRRACNVFLCGMCHL